MEESRLTLISPATATHKPRITNVKNLMNAGFKPFNFEELFRFLKKQDFKGALNIEVYRNAYKDFEEINNSFMGITQIYKKI